MSNLLINQKTLKDTVPYIGGFKGKKVELYAHSLADAKQKVVEYFKPKKADRGLIWVMLASE